MLGGGVLEFWWYLVGVGMGTREGEEVGKRRRKVKERAKG